MPYGYGFRGWSPPWPYVGQGRGGLPRCWYYGAAAPPYWYPAVQQQFPYAPYAAAPPPEQEIEMLREQAAAMKGQLDEIEARIRELTQE